MLKISSALCFGFWGFGLLASGAMAGSATLFECQITHECLDQEACAESGFELQIERSAGSSDPFQLITPAETIDGVFMDDNSPVAATHLVARQTGAYHMLTIQTDGALRWSVHMPIAEMAISYFGTCEGSV